MKKAIKMAGLFGFALFLFSCGKEQAGESLTLEKIHSEQGVPVKVKTAEPQEFTRSLLFNGTVKGLRESSGSALVSDAVEAILFDVGDFVEKGQAVIRFPENNPAASYYQAEAGFRAAEQAFKRVENLYRNNGVSRQSYDDARTQYEVQQANWKNVQDLVRVTAPISGYITRMNVSVSDNVRPGAELFTVSNYRELTATIYASDDQIGEIAAGQKVTASWNDERIDGVVTQVDLAKDPSKKAFAVKIRLDNGSLAIPSGVACELTVETEKIADAFVLHRKEFLREGAGDFAMIARNGVAVKQFIVAGEQQGMYYRILSGLEAGDPVITEGLQLVSAGEKIRIMGDDKALVASR